MSSGGHWEWVSDGNILLAIPFLIRVILPFVCPMLIGFSIYYFTQYSNDKQIAQQNIAVEDVINNPGEAWEQWGLLWETSDTWGELKEPFAEVQRDWENRGITVTWEGMTNVFSRISVKTFPQFKSSLFSALRNEYYKSNINQDTCKTELTAAIVMMVFGVIIALYLVIMTSQDGISGLFFKFI